MLQKRDHTSACVYSSLQQCVLCVYVRMCSVYMSACVFASFAAPAARARIFPSCLVCVCHRLYSNRNGIGNSTINMYTPCCNGSKLNSTSLLSQLSSYIWFACGVSLCSFFFPWGPLSFPGLRRPLHVSLGRDPLSTRLATCFVTPTKKNSQLQFVVFVYYILHLHLLVLPCSLINI